MLTRVTNNQIVDLVYRYTHANLGRMSKLQEMASTGRRVNDYADDPQAVGLMQRYESLIKENSQFLENIDRARTMVEQTDAALLDLVELVRDSRDVVLRELSGNYTAASNRIGATEIDSMIELALAIGNQSIQGNSLFGGFRTDLQAFIESGNEVVYQGDQGVMTVQIGPNTDMSVNIPGSELLGSDVSSLYGYGDMAPRLTLSTSLGDIGYGGGWQPGTIQWTDSNDVPYEVDLSGSGTISDVIDILNAAGLNVSISADGAGLTVSDPGGGPLTISDPSGGDTALSLGLIGTSAEGTITGSDIRVSPDWTVNLVDIESLAGGLPLGSIELTIDGTSIAVDLSTAVTLDNVRTLFEAAVTGAGLPPLTMELGENALQISSNNADSFEITELAGDDTARRLGLVGQGRPHRLFDVLIDLRDALNATDRDGIKRAQGELTAIEDHLLELEMSIGGRETMLDWMQGLNMDRDYNLNRNLADVRDADLFQVTSDLKQAETTYQASLMVASQMMKMSLFDYL